MAYAHCPACRATFRYQALAQEGPAWLKLVARQAGRGEQAALLCYGCWRVLRVGDLVEVIQPPHAQPHIARNAKGMVVDLGIRDDGTHWFDVDGLEEVNGFVWRCTVTRRQLRAENPFASETTRVSIDWHRQAPAE